MDADLPKSRLADLRGTPLADLAGPDPEITGEAVRRVLPEMTPPVPVAAFQSAI